MDFPVSPMLFAKLNGTVPRQKLEFAVPIFVLVVIKREDVFI